MADFKPGDVVRLKSGGPNMTVTSHGDKIKFFRGQIFCQWFVGTKLEKGHFSPDVLILVDELENKKE